MRIRDFREHRRAQLHKFFFEKFGRGWRHYLRVHFLFSGKNARVEEWECIAIGMGFDPILSCPVYCPFERKFFARLAQTVFALSAVSFIGPPPTLGEVLCEWTGRHQRYWRDRSDIIDPNLLVLDGVPQRMLSPSLAPFSPCDALRAVLDIAVTKPPGAHVEPIGGQGPDQIRSVVAARDENCLVSDFEI